MSSLPKESQQSTGDEKAGPKDDVSSFDDNPKKVDEAVDSSLYTDEEYRVLKKKIDRYLLPLMWFAYGVQQVDKTGISTQATFGIREYTNLEGQQYQWLTTIFYITYMCCEFPSSFLMQKLEIGRTLSVLIFCWGLIVLCTAFAKNWDHLMALRALQGAFECTISPSFLLIIGSWYKTKEHGSRTLFFTSANAGFGAIAELCKYGICKHMQDRNLQAWKGVSYFLGSITLALAVFSFLILGTPREVMWLTKEEKAMASARVAENKTGSDKKKREWKWYQVREAFKDPQTYFFFFQSLIGSLPNGGITSFGNLIFMSFGFDNLETIIKGIVPRNIFSVAWFFVVAFSTMKWHNIRLYLMMASMLPSFVGFLAMGLLPNDPSLQWTKWGMYFITPTCNAAMFLMWTLVPSNVAGRTKKSITSSMVFVGYCVGNSIGAQIFRTEHAPRYIPAIVANSVFYAVSFVLFVFWRLYYLYENKRRDKVAREQGISEEERNRLGELAGEEDRTDFENQHFRYST